MFSGNRLENNIFLLIYAQENWIFRTSTVKTLHDTKYKRYFKKEQFSQHTQKIDEIFSMLFTL
jgi:hypothetical protein